ncbi:hypothetical protein H112_05587 [Trichophyton rubrum D6]|uniref:Uncharacterized protein n=3 Tax=Trichophyton TaxID=5550 RepID=F2SJW2_TRIRC|nr:uncharacterized protein TERG_03316 [Trichophyton rubrum CBS 118892]EZF16581.1 hypothetical protein H100_05605 [Trichophyton rubrum MR850]EZF40260.1 hypothetical protein H102_05572 [Trichophyton rubrum CBS 100081]EZF51085.1 hypothetical protein H103_05595 [Trichophyton rubrum CBS 288.86]EZF61485.1 hypothetical protein H104_05586 [Trichophyton rubrum CBS 289.86]EZF72247.1 hypothetical protein H105_05613 [Trichophyton soudanense CBS 452.61]EZF82906.1 hypothetical protein H110_05595 [Trichophy
MASQAPSVFCYPCPSVRSSVQEMLGPSNRMPGDARRYNTKAVLAYQEKKHHLRIRLGPTGYRLAVVTALSKKELAPITPRHVSNGLFQVPKLQAPLDNYRSAVRQRSRIF